MRSVTASTGTGSRRTLLTARALAVRVAVVPLAAAATLLLPTVNGPVVALASTGALIAVFAPPTGGALPLLLLEILTWLFGWSPGQASTERTLAFAVLLYLLHASTALAADIPWAAQVEVRVLSRWPSGAYRVCLPPLVAPQ